MIISWRNRFILIHVPKNAGMYVTERLLGDVDYGDVVINGPTGRIVGRPVLTRIGNQMRIKPGLNVSSLSLSLSLLVKLRKHSFANEVKANLPGYDRFRRFCIIRNPYDRVVSQYHYIIRFRGAMKNQALQRLFADIKATASFEKFTNDWLPKVQSENFFAPQCRYLSGDQYIDTIFYENLESEFSEFMTKYQLMGGLPSPPRNVSYRNRDYQAYYNLSTRKAVEAVYRDDVERFSYEF